MMRCGTTAHRGGPPRAPGKARRARCGAVGSAMKGTDRERKGEFALHGSGDTLYHRHTSFHAQLHAMATSSSIDARLSRADAFAAEHGLAWTPLRRQVYERVLAAQRPIGAYDLLAELEPQRGRVPPTTVYRALDFLVEHGFIHRIESKNAFFACCEIGVPHEGQFLICDSCGDTVEIPGGDLAKQLSASEPAHGFEVHHQVVELSGLCGHCKRKPAQR
ncbi:Zinc uptake regulation protein ZUR [Burkholderia cepacia]|nr:Zinc uptake regulation protein ZUR [Burkholderia cepacia]